MSDLNKLRQLFRKRYIKHVLTSVLLGGKYRTIVDHFWEDLRKILIYDCKRQKRKEAYVPLPQIWSNDGKKVLKLFLEAYENERPMTDMQWESILIERGGWRCACGRTNAAYTSTCVCGKSRKEIPTEKQQPVLQPDCWNCSCGRINPLYTSTCVCGMNKREFWSQQKEER